MTDQLSPFTRKVVAVGLLILLLLSLLNLVLLPLAGAIGTSLDRLADARFRRARLAMLEASPPVAALPAPSSTLLFRANDASQAGEAVSALVRETAVRTGVSVEIVLAGSPATFGVAMDLVGTGPELSIVEFVNQLEQGMPAVRFEHWKLTRGSDAGQLRFEARARAAWAPR